MSFDWNNPGIHNPRDILGVLRDLKSIDSAKELEKTRKLLEEQARLQKEANELEKKKLAQEQERLKQGQQQYGQQLKQQQKEEEERRKKEEEERRKKEEEERRKKEEEERRKKGEEWWQEERARRIEREQRTYDLRLEAMIRETDVERKVTMFRLFEEDYGLWLYGESFRGSSNKRSPSKDCNDIKRLDYNEIIRWGIPLPEEEIRQRLEEKRKQQELEKKRQEEWQRQEEERKQELEKKRQEECQRQEEGRKRMAEQVRRENLELQRRMPEFSQRLETVKQQIQSHDDLMAYAFIRNDYYKCHHTCLWRSFCELAGKMQNYLNPNRTLLARPPAEYIEIQLKELEYSVLEFNVKYEQARLEMMKFVQQLEKQKQKKNRNWLGWLLGN